MFSKKNETLIRLNITLHSNYLEWPK